MTNGRHTGPVPAHPGFTANGVERTTLLVGVPAPAELTGLLRAANVRVLSSASAEEALGILMRHAVDCLVVDTRLSGMSAGDLLAEVRRRHDPPTLIIEAANNPSRSTSAWIDAGATDCVDDRTSAAIVAARCGAILRRRRVA